MNAPGFRSPLQPNLAAPPVPRRAIPIALGLLLAAGALLILSASPRPAAASDASSTGPSLRLPSLALERADRPIRHRRPGRGFSRPEYFATIGGGAFDPSDQPGSGLYLNGAFGSVLADRLDLGLQLSWYHRSTGGSEFVQEYQDPAGNTRRDVIQLGDVNTDLVPVMATLRVRFPTSSSLEPYVGGSLGWEWLTIEGTDANGLSFSDDYDGFGAQALGGANIKLNPEVALYGEAVWNISTPSAEFYDPGLGAIIKEEVKFDGVGFHAGLRFRF
jgi:opacity protein-like surface antigen